MKHVGVVHRAIKPAICLAYKRKDTGKVRRCAAGYPWVICSMKYRADKESQFVLALTDSGINPANIRVLVLFFTVLLRFLITVFSKYLGRGQPLLKLYR